MTIDFNHSLHKQAFAKLKYHESGRVPWKPTSGRIPWKSTCGTAARTKELCGPGCSCRDRGGSPKPGSTLNPLDVEERVLHGWTKARGRGGSQHGAPMGAWGGRRGSAARPAADTWRRASSSSPCHTRAGAQPGVRHGMGVEGGCRRAWGEEAAGTG